MNKPRYVGFSHTDQARVEAVLATGNVDAICQAMVDAAFSPVDPLWVQQVCVDLARSPEVWLRRIACVVIGHVGRMHPAALLPEAIAALRQLKRHPDTAGEAEDAIEDIEQASQRLRAGDPGSAR